jgi:hypothetical protein
MGGVAVQAGSINKSLFNLQRVVRQVLPLLCE